jgi:hypothetical protein
MPRLARFRPSPAMVVAIVALIVACAGTATAASVLIDDSSQVARGSINSADLQNGRGVGIADLTPRTRFRLRGARGPEGPAGPRGVQGPQGARGAEGAEGVAGSALAFAYVNSDGTFDAARAKGVNSVAVAPSAPTSGIYCFDLAPPARNAVASIDAFSAQTNVEAIYPILPGTDNGDTFLGLACPPPQQDAAVFVNDDSGSNPQRAFWIAFN